MKCRSFLSRHRLLINVLALAFAIGALVLPPTADAQEIICETGCVEWDVQTAARDTCRVA